MRHDGLFLILMGCLLTSCVSAAREREARCLGATLMDVWETEHEVTSAEEAWRTAQRARAARSAAGGESSDARSSAVAHAALRHEGLWAMRSMDDPLYGRIVGARARHREAMKWHGVVTRRVQTRIEEDEMLYPVLGMLATSTAIVLYPLVRWNVRSVLWEGADPDAADDPVQSFCAGRLGEQQSALRS